MGGYAVIDFETTGLFPAKHDRVVEVGVVLVDDSGEIESEWSSLVNPQRDVGPTHIHGVTAREVVAAPTFAAIAPYLLDDLAGRTVVAHNIRFDLLFLAYELTRAGFDLPQPVSAGLCTMELANRHLAGRSRRLADCCREVGVELRHAHSAVADARAAAQLLAVLMDHLGEPQPWSDLLHGTRAYGWPVVAPPRPPLNACARGALAEPLPGAWLDRLVPAMPRHPDATIDAYLDLLDAALLDRYLSAFEEDALLQMAALLGLDTSLLGDIHRTYLRGLGRLALADGVVTEVERADVVAVAALLGLSPSDVDHALGSVTVGNTPASGRLTLRAGQRIALTGQMSRGRDEVTVLAERHGLRVGSLTKNTDVLVAADPDSLSGKAAKARAYGVPVVSEQSFWGALAKR